MNIQPEHIGQQIEFNCKTIMKGNPVKGEVTFVDDEWIDVKVNHYIEGISSVWHQGDKKSFRKSLISEIKFIEQ